MLVFKKTIPTAKIGKHKIFSLDNVDMITLFEIYPNTESNELKYRKFIKDYDMEIGFFSSYTYDLTRTLP